MCNRLLTKFTVSNAGLAAIDRADRPVADPAECADDRPPVRVLLTDDNAVNRKVAALILDAVGAEIVHAENGEEALLAFQAQTFDVVLMDLQMPVMDGLTAIQLMRGHEANTGAARTPILVLSANALPEHRQASPWPAPTPTCPSRSPRRC